MQIINKTSCTIYVEETGIMKRGQRGLSFKAIVANEKENVFDAVIQRIYSEEGTALIVIDKETKIFGNLKVTQAPEKDYGKNAIIIENNKDR